MLTCAVAVVLTLSLFSAYACSLDSTPTPTQTGLSVEEILSRAADRFEILQSFHFKMTHDGGATPIALGLEMETVEGDVVAPDRMAVTIEAKASGLFFEVEAITMGDDTYMTNPFTQKFENLSDTTTVGGFFDAADGVGSIITTATNPFVLSIEALSGVPVYRLGGMVRSEDLQSISPSATEGNVLEVELWIGQEDFLVRKLTLDGRITEEEEEGIVRTIILSRFDEAVTIERPRIDGGH